MSRLKAEHSGLWHRAADGSERERTAPAQPAAYDGASLAAFVAEAVADDAAWEPWFQSQEITPLRLSYEELSADPRAALARILVGLGKDPAPASAVAPRTARLADAESLGWIFRFEGEEASRPA